MTNRIAKAALVFVVALFAGRSERAQTTVTPAGQRTVVAGQDAATDTHNPGVKQSVLATEADRLLAMATELKAQVDMTNKNILSVKVVRKAEEIELYAHRMKDEAKR